MQLRLVRGSIALAAMLAASRLGAQTGTGSIAGVVNGPNNRPLSGVVVQVSDVRLGGYTSEDGRYTIGRVPAGSHRVIARLPGFISDTVSVTVTADKPVTQDFVLKPTSVTLQTVTISSPRLNETQAAALQQEKTAENLVSVMSGDEIRSLPNYNAAEAAARIPGVTSERDEGEGKFAEIRGTPPWFQNVEIDGVHIPGTLNGDRSVKLDDVPADLLGSIEVDKTMSADQDADAIGGTINLHSKIPEGAPRGYVEGRYSYQTLENNSQGMGSLTYGGRVGNDGKLGFLLGGSYDRTNRVIEDVEPSWEAEIVQNGVPTQDVPQGGGFNKVFPTNWSQREYNYYRTRYGFNTDLDYRFTPTSTVYFRGLYSAFFDEANRWVTSVASDGSSGPAGNGDLGNNIAAGRNVNLQVSNRGPVEHTWGFTGGGKHISGPVQLDWSGNFSGSTATTHEHFDQNWTGPLMTQYNYGASTNLVPQYNPTVTGFRAAMQDPANYTFKNENVSNEAIDGQNFGGQVNALVPFAIGDLPASFKVGAKYTNEHKADSPDNSTITYSGSGNPPTLQGLVGQYNVNGFYNHFCAGCYTLAPFGSMPALRNIIGQGGYTNTVDDYGNLSGNFSGTEQIVSGYGMGTVDIGSMHVNLGVRVENTNIGYRAYADTGGANTGTVQALSITRRLHSYTDVFPSAQLRYALDENTNLRFAYTRGIARPNYSDLAPTFNTNGVDATNTALTNPLSAGNPALKPEFSWNTDLLFEHYFPSVGALRLGAFYKDISDFIFNRTVIYTGQVRSIATYLQPGTTFWITQPQNGPHAWLYGFEADYSQHFSFLPGALAGIGFDANWTWVQSRATVPMDTTMYPGAAPFRHAPIERQFPNLFNISLLYDYSTITARVSGQYTAASIYGYGNDGTSNPNTGDNWNFPHWQIDASLAWTVYGGTALTVQALNLNNAYFGFFNGLSSTPNHWNTQREYYGTTLYIGVRQGF